MPTIMYALTIVLLERIRTTYCLKSDPANVEGEAEVNPLFNLLAEPRRGSHGQGETAYFATLGLPKNTLMLSSS